MRGLVVLQHLLRHATLAVRQEVHRFGWQGAWRRLPWHLAQLPSRLRMLGQPASAVEGAAFFEAAAVVRDARPTASSTPADPRPLRLAFAMHQFLPEFTGGTERVAFEMARVAMRAGHHVEVICGVVDERGHGGPPHPRIPELGWRELEGLGVTLVPASLLGLPAFTGIDVHPPALATMERWLRDGRFDVLHVWHPMRMTTLAAAAHHVGLPVVVTLTDFFSACRRHFLVDAEGGDCPGPDRGERCARRCPAPGWDLPASLSRHRTAAAWLASASARVAPSAFVAERLAQAFDGQEFEVLPHGVEVNALRAAAESAPPPVPPAAPGTLRLLFAGTILPAKGLDLLLQALALLPGRPLQLLVAGPFGHDAGHECEIRRLAASDGRVALLGQRTREELAALMSCSDLLCLPSRVPESFSLVLHEAAALGLPALVADRGAPAQALGHGGGGRVQGDHPRDWARALQAWVEDADLRVRWREAVVCPASVEQEAQRYAAIYRSALARAGA